MATAIMDQIVTEMGKAVGEDCGLNGTLKFDFGEPGSVLIDGRARPNAVSLGDGKTADCTIHVSLENFEQMVEGKLDGMTAFMQGKLKVAGDMGLAMKIGPILEKGRR